MTPARWHSLSIALWWWTPLICALAVVVLLVLRGSGLVR